jgi:hypothetical protein
MDLGLFVGQGTIHHVIWAYPQSNFMRHLLDVLILIFLWQHLHSDRKLWWRLAAAAGGLSLFLVTDNGVFVLLMLAFYVLLRLISAWSRGDRGVFRSGALQSIAGLLTLVGVFLLGAVLVGRGSTFDPDFWWGWLRGIVDSGGAQGYGSWPLADVSGPWLLLFVLMFCTYVVALCLAMVAALDGGKHRENLFFGCIGAYGLSTLIYFVGRSQMSVLPQVTLPFVLLAVPFGARLCGRMQEFLSEPGQKSAARRVAVSAVKAASWALLLAATVSLLRHTDRVTYANPIAFAKGLTYETVLAKNQIWTAFEPETGCLFTEPLQACGMGRTAQQRFREAVDRMAGYARDGRTIAVVSTFDTTYYYGAKIPPWNQQIPLFTVHTEERRQLYIEHLVESRPDYVFVVGSNPTGYDVFFDDTFKAVESALQASYFRDIPATPFNVWRLSPR